MKNFNYLKCKESVYNDMTNLYSIVQVYHSFIENFGSPELSNKICARTPNILIILQNSLLSKFYITLRRLLSLHENELSLLNLHKEIIKPLICAFNAKDPDIELQKQCLPNCYDKWLNLKKYINKNITHVDSNCNDLSIKFTWQDVDVMFKDLQHTFDNITLKEEKITYTFDVPDVRCLSDSLFKKMSSFESNV